MNKIVDFLTLRIRLTDGSLAFAHSKFCGPSTHCVFIVCACVRTLSPGRAIEYVFKGLGSRIRALCPGGRVVIFTQEGGRVSQNETAAYAGLHTEPFGRPPGDLCVGHRRALSERDALKPTRLCLNLRMSRFPYTTLAAGELRT